MAKKKSKKKSSTKMIVSIIVLVLSVLTICTLFMPLITIAGKASLGAIGGETELAVIKGSDILTAAFNGKIDLDFSEGANLLIGLKSAESTAFVGTIFIWGYLLTVAVAAISLVFAGLSLLGFKFNFMNMLVGVVLAILAIIAFIFAIIVAGKLSGESGIAGVISAGKTASLAIGSYLLIATLICAGSQAYFARKK